MSEWERGKTRNREIATLRKRYVDHRELLSRMIADAPADRLAQSYMQVRAEIDAAIAKIDEIEGGRATTAPIDLKPQASAAAGSTHPALRGTGEAEPLAIDQDLLRDDYIETPHRRAFPAAAAVAVVLVLLSLLAFVVWRFARNVESTRSSIVEETATSVEPATTATEPLEPPPAAQSLAITPVQYDYGIIRKGTRKTQKFSMTNNSDGPLTVRTGRSNCRCLWFEHPDTILPGATGALTITVDGGRAQAGPVSETVVVSSRDKPDISARIQVTARVQ
jgi:Na+-transporting methylmalonyl-CoA/oxaloacetate decarboxylase gamma subunit